MGALCRDHPGPGRAPRTALRSITADLDGCRDLEAMGHRSAAPVARLVVAMAAEIALVELERDAPDRAMRRALFQLLEPRG